MLNFAEDFGGQRAGPSVLGDRKDAHTAACLSAKVGAEPTVYRPPSARPKWSCAPAAGSSILSGRDASIPVAVPG